MTNFGPFLGPWRPDRAKEGDHVLIIFPMFLVFFCISHLATPHNTHTPIPHAFLYFPLVFSAFFIHTRTPMPHAPTRTRTHTHTLATDHNLESGLILQRMCEHAEKPRNMPEKGKVRGLSGEGSFRYRRANRSSAAKWRKTNRTIW